MKKQPIPFIILALVNLLFLSVIANAQQTHATIYPAPPGEPLSQEYRVSVAGQEVPVYMARIAPADSEKRWKAMDDKKNSADYYDTGAFAYFDLQGTANVTITVPSRINTAKILPSSAGITPSIHGNSISFPVSSPRNLTIEINGEWVRSLHLFINPPEVGAPRADDPDVIYFGPGIHEVSHLVVGDNKTVYLAGGAIVRAVIRPDEKYSISSYSGLRTYAPTIELLGENISIRGRGIIDAGGCTTHSRNMIVVRGSNITLEGIILRDSPTWTIPVRESDHVKIDNIKLIGYRANSDGIDICNSRNVTVENCFIRTLDDLIVVKTPRNGKGEVKSIVARNCVLWNQVAHALSIGAEITKNVDDVLFTDCDIIHDQGREWSLRVYQSDAAQVSNVRFENIRIEESIKFISLWIGKAVWSTDQDRGNIQGITFKNIRAAGAPLTIDLKGFDGDHGIGNVIFEHVTLNDKHLTSDMVHTNEFVKNVSIQP